EVNLSGTGGTQATVINYLKAIELCNETTSTATGANKKWGVITNNTGNIFAPRFRKADGTNTPLVAQTAIRPRFGTSATMNPRAGNWFSVLSTGHAAAEGQANPGFVAWQNPASGQLTNNTSGVYSDWRTAVGGTAPAAPGCSVQS